jgi:glycosyltransferase involved in cell wall biosynthesis
MKILILSFYYPPDLSAGSFRTAALVERLQRVLPPDASIDVITTQPNRYKAIAQATATDERNGMLRVRRIALPPHASGMRDQAAAFTAYFRGAIRMTAGERYDLVYGTSSRLFTAILSAIVARRARAPLYLDIRDIFVDTMKDVLPRKISTAALPFLKVLERFAIGRAQRVNLVSAGFLPWFQKRFPNKHFDTFPNGIDEAFLANQVASKPAENGRRLVLYAGNIGDGQGLHNVLPELAKRCADNYDFVVIGDGGKRAALAAALTAANVKNVTLRDPVSRSELIPLYQSADVLFLHLNAYDAFLKVLPSKLFEYAALGKPILAGVDGFSRSFIETEVPGAAVFAPCDAAQGERALRSLTLGPVDRAAFIDKYRRANTMDRLAEVLLSIASKPAH